MVATPKKNEAEPVTFGASSLENLLKNYASKLGNKVKVGVVGFPGVGKRSVIRSLQQVAENLIIEKKERKKERKKENGYSLITIDRFYGKSFSSMKAFN